MVANPERQVFSWQGSYSTDELRNIHVNIFRFMMKSMDPVTFSIISFLEVHVFFSIPEPKTHWWAYRIGRPPLSVICHPHSLNIFSSETAGPVKVKFHIEPPWDGGKKVCSTGLGHMTKLAAMPIYGKNLKKSSSLEPKGQWPWKLVCSIEYYQVCSNDDPELTLTYFMARSNLIPYGFVWGKR